MAMSAAATAALKKLATAAATDKRAKNSPGDCFSQTRPSGSVAKTIGMIIGIAILILITPILAIITIFQSGAQLDMAARAAQSQNERLVYFETVMMAIEDEIQSQNLAVDPVEAQIIYLCALQGREAEPDFYVNYITCFANGQDRFEAIGAAFGVAFTPQDVEQIEQLIASAQAAQTGPGNSIHAKIAELTKDDDTPEAPGDFACPLRVGDWKSLITSGFGMRVHPITGERKFHTGLDLGVTEGTAVYPAKPGKVLLTGNDPNGYGLYLVVYHGGGMATLYGHCSKILVTEGQEVTAETVIARSGNTGQSTGPHLHFEVVQNGAPQNPKKFLK